MSFSDQLRAGVALAATIAKDAGAERARAGLAARSVDALTALARELAGLPKAARRARVRALMSPSALPAPTLTSAASEPPRSARVRAVLGLAAGSGDGQPLLARAGYVPDPHLLALLQRIAARITRDAARGARQDVSWRA